MGKTVVVYKSRYGAAKQYAKWISAALDADLLELGPKTPDALKPYSTVIYGGGLYAGSINGISEFKKIFKRYNDRQFVLYAVGLGSADNPDSLAQVGKNFTPEMHAKVKAFYFRGSIDYGRLGFIHRVIMAAVVKLMGRKKPGELSTDDNPVLSSYGKTVSFLDEASIEPLLAHVCSLNVD